MAAVERELKVKLKAAQHWAGKKKKKIEKNTESYDGTPPQRLNRQERSGKKKIAFDFPR